MPVFETVPLNEALSKSSGSKRMKLVQQYIDFIGQLRPGSAGKVAPSAGETPIAVRRRLNQAAKLAGKELKVVRSGDELYFWLQEAPARRRGRPRKVQPS
jgi:hypothetical protein